MDTRIIKIARRLKNYFLDSLVKENDISIFLCGGASSSDATLRRNLGGNIEEIKSRYRYSVLYPEDMFIEMILGHQRHDLLTLENLLAESVHAVVILVQSPGTFTELGAFSNHAKLKNKLILVIDPRYKKSQSFVMTGPVRYLRKETSSQVIYEKMKSDNLSTLSKNIRKSARKIRSEYPPVVNLANPIASYEFYLALIFTFDPIPRFAVLELAKILEPDYLDQALTVAETVINNLVNKRDARLVSDKILISKKGLETLYAGSQTDKKQTDIKLKLSGFRMDALKILLRKRKKGVWGVAA